MSTAFGRGVTAAAAAAGHPVAAALVATILFAGVASAQHPLAPRFSLDGFGTVGLIYSTEDQADFIDNTTASEGPGFSNTIDATVDSRLGVQATLRVGQKLSAVVQVIAEQSSENDYIPHAEWANLSYSFSPDFSLRGGRIVLPVFLVSDSRKVTYSNPWVRPPVEIYGMVPIYSLDGADATYRRHLGEWTASLNGAFGRTHANFPGGIVEAEKTWIVNTSLMRGAITGRLAAAGGELSVEQLTPLFDGFRAFGAAGQEIAARYDVDSTPFGFATAAVEYDPGAWFTIGEIAWLDTHSGVGEKISGHFTAGFRRGAITPYATYSQVTLLSESTTAGLPLTGLPPQVARAAAELNVKLNTFLARAPVQRNLAIGGRWDFLPGIALKAQIDFLRVLGNSRGTFTNFQPTFEPGKVTRIVSLSTAFVF